MKTAVDELIEQIDNEVSFLSSLHGKEIFGRKVGLAFAKRVALELKEMEKEQIKKSFSDGAQWELYGSDLTYEERAEQYYNETFKQEE